MTVQTANPIVQVLPETAPFSEEQRSWLKIGRASCRERVL